MVRATKYGKKLNVISLGKPGTGKAFHPWDELKLCSECGEYPYMVGSDGEDFISGSPYKIFCKKCLKSTSAKDDFKVVKTEWNNALN